MRQFILAIVLMCFSASPLFSQNRRNADSINVMQKKIQNGDTVLISNIPEINVFPGNYYRGWWDKRKYLRLIRNVKAAYPYAKIAGLTLRDLDLRLASMNSDRQRKALIESSEKQLKKEFEGALKSLTITQGRILIKLIHRETGNTTFIILKDKKGSFSAGFWQTIARIFGNNLKSEYDPFGEDIMIEMIIGLIESGQV